MPDGPSRAAAPQLLWTPNNATIDTARITAFLAWLRRERGIELDGYHELWQWSVADLAGFWDAVRVFFDVRFAAPAERVLGDRAMPGASWFAGAQVNYADHLLGCRRRRAGPRRGARGGLTG
jgi:acetoacetyl-CoA synthetase